MKNNKWMYTAAIAALLMMSACGEQSDTSGQEAPASSQTSVQPGASASPSAGGSAAAPAATTSPSPAGSGAAASEEPADQKILIVIDQTEKPIEGNSFDFGVKQLPAGYMLAEMRWISGDTKIVNTLQEAIEHGGNGEDGFYISGDGQYMGFFYPDDLKGQEGEVSFLFKDEQGNEKTWAKKITLK